MFDEEDGGSKQGSDLRHTGEHAKGSTGSCAGQCEAAFVTISLYFGYLTCKPRRPTVNKNIKLTGIVCVSCTVFD